MTYRPDRGVLVLQRNLASTEAALAGLVARLEAKGWSPERIARHPSAIYYQRAISNLHEGIARRTLLNSAGPAAPPAQFIEDAQDGGAYYDPATGGYETGDTVMPVTLTPPGVPGWVLPAAAGAALLWWLA